jgi:glutathione S-transferase
MLRIQPMIAPGMGCARRGVAPFTGFPFTIACAQLSKTGHLNKSLWGKTMTHPYTAAVTLLVLLLYLMLGTLVAQARGKYGVKAPAVTGNEQFERIYRVQMNTLEQMVFFFPAMWLYALTLNDIGAAVGGLIWIVGRVIYANAYIKNPASRELGFTVALIAAIGLFLGAAYAVVKALV